MIAHVGRSDRAEPTRAQRPLSYSTARHSDQQNSKTISTADSECRSGDGISGQWFIGSKYLSQYLSG